MPYPITLSDGITTLISIPDLMILGPLEINAPSNCSLNLVGRGAPNYGDAINTNFVWMLQNFAAATAPVQPLVGQLWYNNTSGASSLNIYDSAGEWVQIASGDSSFTMTGDLIVQDGLGDLVELYGSGAIRLLKTNYKPHIIFEGLANCTNAVSLCLGTDSFGNPDLTIYSPVFANAVPGFIWHSDNVTPFDLLRDNTVLGVNVFNAPQHFEQIIVDVTNGAVNDGAYVDITPGTVTLVNVTGGAPQLVIESPNPASTNYVAFSYSDPDAVLNFFTGTAPGGNLAPGTYTSPTPQGTLTFTPTTDLSAINTVYHTGNLQPIIQNPPNSATQTITGGLELTGPVIGNGGGSFVAPLTLGGSEVYTVAGGTIVGPATIDSLLTVTGGGKITGGLNADGITSTGGYINIGALGDGNGVPQLGFYTTTGVGQANIFCNLTSPPNYAVGFGFNNSGEVPQGSVVQTGLWQMASNGDVYSTGTVSAQSDISSLGGSLVADLGVFGSSIYAVAPRTSVPASISFGVGTGASITAFTSQISSYNNNLVFIAGTTLSGSDSFTNGMVLDDAGDLSLYTSGGGGNFSTTSGNITTQTGTVQGATITQTSDASLKTNIRPLEHALDLIAQLRGVRYTRKSSGREEIGVIAQEVQPVVPELVSENDQGVLMMAYGNALALCLNAINELRTRLETLETQQGLRS